MENEKREKLSVIILTSNEADTIVRCLSSVAFADEIILIDNSTDNTVALAQTTLPQAQLKIVSDSNNSDFAKLRNRGLELAKNEWVLFLDADEEISQELKGEMDSRLSAQTGFRKNDKTENENSKKGNENNSIVGFYLKRRDFFLGKWLQFGETAHVSLLKLGKKSAGTWSRSVHEVWNIEGSTETLDAYLNHYPHPTVAEFLERINRWTDLNAQEFLTQGKRTNAFEIIAYPVGKFIQNYFVRQGFRDAMPGLIMAIMMSFHSFLTRAKLFMLTQKK